MCIVWVQSAIGLTHVIILRLSDCASSERLCAKAALLDHFPWSCLDASLVSVQVRWWRLRKCRRALGGAYWKFAGAEHDGKQVLRARSPVKRRSPEGVIRP